MNFCRVYDVNNNISETIIYQPNVTFEGTNLSITGTDNVISRDLFSETINGVHFGGKDSVLPETGEDGAIKQISGQLDINDLYLSAIRFIWIYDV